jgi:hypothetical protein
MRCEHGVEPDRTPNDLPDAVLDRLPDQLQELLFTGQCPYCEII